MLNIYLFKVTKKVNSTSKPATNTAYLTLTGALKDPTSIINPTLQISTSSDLSQVNYCYVSDLHRYYWVNDIVYNRGMYELRCTVDVLATYKTAIGSTSMYVLRASAQKNGAIKDTYYPLTGTVTYSSTAFDSPTIGGYKDGFFVISTVGQANQAGQTIYQMNATQFANVLNQLMASADGSVSWGGLAQGIKNSILNPTDYIVSAFWFPYAFTTDGQAEFKCGLWSSGVQVDVLHNSQGYKSYSVSVPKHPQAAARGKYMNLAPFTYYALDMGFMGSIQLDASMLIDNSAFTVYVWPDPLTGTARVEARTQATSYMQLCNVTCAYGVPLNIAMGKNNIGNVLSGFAEVAAGVVSADPVRAVKGVADGIGDVASGIAGTVSSNGSVGSIEGHIRSKRLFARFYEAAANDNTREGSPLCSVTTPATLASGFIKPEKCDISVDATDNEIRQIKALVEAGFYYE